MEFVRMEPWVGRRKSEVNVKQKENNDGEGWEEIRKEGKSNRRKKVPFVCRVKYILQQCKNSNE